MSLITSLYRRGKTGESAKTIIFKIEGDENYEMKRTERVTIRITKDEEAAIAKLAADEVRTISGYIRYILMKEVEEVEKVKQNEY